METSLVHCLEHCYLCCALVTIRSNELVIFHGIALYSDDKYILRVLYENLQVFYEIYTTCFDQSDHSICNNYDLKGCKDLVKNLYSAAQQKSRF